MTVGGVKSLTCSSSGQFFTNTTHQTECLGELRGISAVSFFLSPPPHLVEVRS